MHYRPSRGFGWSLAILLALGGGGWAAWWKVNSAPEEIRLKGVWAALRTKEREERKPKPWAPGEKAELDRKAKALTEKLLAEFPALQVTPRPVAAEENGFLLLQQLNPPRLSLSHGEIPKALRNQPRPATIRKGKWEISKEFEDLLCSGNWYHGTSERLLAEHAKFVAHVERIAALTTRSSSNISQDLSDFEGVRSGKFCSDVLLFKARVAAESGNEDETLRLVAAAKNIGSHFHEIEKPCLMGETVTILIDKSASSSAFQNLLPALGPKADLARWRALLGSRAYNTAEFAKVMRGEWHVGAACVGHPMLLTAQRNGGPAGAAEEVARAIAQWYSDLVTGLPKVGIAELGSGLHAPGNGSGGSKEAKAMVEYFASELEAWARGYARYCSVFARDQAALELLKLEQDGETLTAADAGRVTRDPVSGKAFGFDPAARTVAMPAGVKAEDKPVKLPW